MAFYKKQQQAVNKKWYPRSVLVGSPVSTDQLSKCIADSCEYMVLLRNKPMIDKKTILMIRLFIVFSFYR